MTKTTATVNAAAEADRLAAEAAEATARADQARARAQEAGRLAAAERQAAVDSIRRRRLNQYDEVALDAEVTAGRRRFADAIREGQPGLSEFVAWQTAAARTYLVAIEAENCRAVLEPDSPRITGSPSELAYGAEVQRVLTSLVHERTSALADEMQAELDAAGR